MKKRVCAITPDQAERRGAAWAIGSFALCPCHLPVTLWMIGAVMSGTAVGALVRGHVVLAGVLITTAWLGGTLHGFNLMRRGRMQAFTQDSSARSRIFGGRDNP